MFNEKLAEALNKQMNNEFYSAHSYMAMAAYSEHNNYLGFAHFYLQQAEEERAHGMKIYKYLNDRGVHVKFSALAEPETDYTSIFDTFEKALLQEKEVTKNIYDLTDLAWEHKEHATISFLRWFLDEQVEEEASFETHIEYLKRIGNDQNALFIYENELGKRSAPAE
ncbi:H-type ferritin FtnA [Siminovitchia terrae]|uniref:Ferritin n=1 Tax=Siminovitchia terrae TaxID=1914933 RepID=A0A429X357_SIMTE|nr:ferritin [Siminovitchia terrae]RST57804.1 ferritin [Siminovitchia terrae]GIN91132.1 H-type ferritin FtnA [Siminovitchia terrae]GIN94957.1 H-type ferritin FtnA [Siminovitchia terrae]